MPFDVARPDSGRRTDLDIDGEKVALEVRHHPRARRMTLRIDSASRAVRLVLPPRTALAEGLDFVARNEGWIGQQLAALPPRIPFLPGALVPILGVDHLIAHRPGERRGVWREAGTLFVSGQAEHVARRVADFLKSEARAEIAPRVRAKAAVVGRKPGRITLRDTTSRWGSCSAAGDLSFSWRLILAPEPVLDYIVAHEVAHLIEMNHGAAFWALTRRLTGDAGSAQVWLRRHGNGLLRYG